MLPTSTIEEASDAKGKFLNLPESVYQSVKHSLITGVFRPGEKISIRGLAATLGLSPTPVRDALQRLAGEGVLVSPPYRSVRVPILSADEVEQLWMVRRLLETEVARIAGFNANDELVAKLSATEIHLDDARQRHDPLLVARLNAEFHFTLYAAAEKPRLEAEIQRQWLSAAPVIRAYMESTQPRDRKGDRIHADILKALRRRDGNAVASCIAEDVSRAGDTIIAAMSGQNEDEPLHDAQSDA